jgi:hypothetical protein
MLVPTMNRHEVTAEVVRDEKKLMDTSYSRLLMEYDRERKKLKIDKTQPYCKAYPIRTAAKNNWIVFIEKSPSAPVYKTFADTAFCCVVYYYSKEGLKVLRKAKGNFAIEAYYGHVFTRYNERLHLNLFKSTDIIQAFFKNNGYSNVELIDKNEKKSTHGICKEGILLGEYKTDPDWLVHKTFISKDLKRDDQDEKEKKLMLDLQIESISSQAQFLQSINSQQVRATIDVFNQINGESNVNALKEKMRFDIPNINSMPFSYPTLNRASFFNASR